MFFAFSSFVMAALKRLPAEQGIAAMQSINVTAVRPVFMSALFGTAAVCLALTWEAMRTWGQQPRAAVLLTGAALYVIGTAGLTIVHHVPLNDALARLDANAAEAGDRWDRYAADWTRWNHVRTGTALAAAGAFTLALTTRPG